MDMKSGSCACALRFVDHPYCLIFGHEAARVHDDATGEVVLDHASVLGGIVGSDEVRQEELAELVVQAHAGHVLVGVRIEQLVDFWLHGAG